METIQTQDTRYLESVGQTDKHQKLSNKYNMVNTSKVIEVFNDLGWFVSKQQQKAVRNPENHGFQKHLVRLQHKDMTPAVVGDTVPELILTGSHDGTSALKISIGAYRLVCLNGLMAGETWASESIRHVGFTYEKLDQAIKSIALNAPKLITTIDGFKSISLDDQEKEIFAKTAIEMIYDGDENSYSVQPRQMLYPKRWADSNKNDLFTTFNIVQEHAIRGGVRQTRPDGSRIRSREVKSIDKNIKINQALWSLTERMAELKRA